MHKLQTSTPQKRKRSLGDEAFASPVKSILRPIGVSTPRALQLQRDNVGVTFKDVRKTSSSPEYSRKPALKAVLSEPEKDIVVKRSKPNSLAKTRQPGQDVVMQDLPKTTTNALNDVRLTPLTRTENVAITTTFDIETYRRTTETEMKRLIRHGQKLREYARKQDEENTRLRQLLHEVQRENERLRKAEEARARQSQTSEITYSTTNSHSYPEPRRVSKTSPSKTYRPPAPLTYESISKYRPPPLQQTHLTSLPPRPAPIHSIPTRSLQETRHTSNPRIPADRVAAARERIRLKAEQRRPPASVSAAVTAPAAGVGDGQAHGMIETSELDWEGL